LEIETKAIKNEGRSSQKRGVDQSEKEIDVGESNSETDLNEAMSERNLQEEIKQQVNDKRKVEVNAHVIGSNKYIT